MTKRMMKSMALMIHCIDEGLLFARCVKHIRHYAFIHFYVFAHVGNVVLSFLIQFCFCILNFAERGKCPPEGVDKSQQRTICLARVNLPKTTTGLVLLRKLSKTAPKRRKTFSKAIFFCIVWKRFWLFDNYDSKSSRECPRWNFRLAKTKPNNWF